MNTYTYEHLIGASTPVSELNGFDAGMKFTHRNSPMVMRGLVKSWPVVQEARASVHSAVNYLSSFYSGHKVVAWEGPQSTKGRVFYSDDFRALNCNPVSRRLDSVLAQLVTLAKLKDAPLLYVATASIEKCLPDFSVENRLTFGVDNPAASIWLGNRTRISAHYDVPENIACNVVGRRRFILFPPEQLENLYIGPVDFTPAGQAISLVDFHNPDPIKFPNFIKAAKSALVVDLEPGDALYIPSMWWHHVEGLDACNVLVNYWWNDIDVHVPPSDALLHGLMAIRQLPEEKRIIWKRLFDYYLFSSDQTFSHIPESTRGVLGANDGEQIKKLCQFLSKRLDVKN